MAKSIRLSILSMAIEFHWRFICWGRKRLSAMFDNGESLSGANMLRVNNRVSHHCLRVTALTERYELLAGSK